MVKYDTKKDKILINGDYFSIGRSKQVKSGIERALDIRKKYLNSELYEKDIAVTNKTIEILYSENKEYRDNSYVKIGFSLVDGTTNDIPDEYIIGWFKDYETHGSIAVKEEHVKSLYEETNCEFNGFQVEFSEDVYKEFTDIIYDDTK